jgi:hypothetical protein
MSSEDFTADSSAPGYSASVLVPSRRAIQLPGTNWVVWQNHVVGEHGRSLILGSEPAAVYLWRLPSREGFTGPAFERDIESEGVHWKAKPSLPLY